MRFHRRECRAGEDLRSPEPRNRFAASLALRARLRVGHSPGDDTMKPTVPRRSLGVFLASVAIALGCVIVAVLLLLNAGSIARPFIIAPGRVVTLAGVPYAWCPEANRLADPVIICRPGGLAFDAHRGYLYVADSLGHGIRRVEADGTVS